MTPSDQPSWMHLAKVTICSGQRNPATSGARTFPWFCFRASVPWHGRNPLVVGPVGLEVEPETFGGVPLMITILRRLLKLVLSWIQGRI